MQSLWTAASLSCETGHLNDCDDLCQGCHSTGGKISQQSKEGPTTLTGQQQSCQCVLVRLTKKLPG